MDQITAIQRRRRNLRIVLFIIILSTLPCYFVGIVLWGTARQGEVSIPTGTATFTPIGFTQGPATSTLIPSITPLALTATGVNPLQPTPIQFIPVATRILTATPIFGPTVIIPSPTTAPTLTPYPSMTTPPTQHPPTDTPIPPPSNTPVPPPTDTPIPTDTPTPSDTPIPSDTPLPLPSDTPPSP